MNRLLVLADVHADVHALRDALAQGERLGCDRIVCAGDLVGYGLFPEETLGLLRERKVACVRGNHDDWGDSERTWGLSPDAVSFSVNRSGNR